MKTTPAISTLITRRKFVGQFSIGAAALTFSLQSRGQSAVAPKKLGMAIVGLGGYAGGQLAPALKMTQNVELRGVVTGSPDKGKKWMENFGFPATSIYGYDTMHRLADNKDIDIVYVVTPNALHAEEVIAAAKAGKHVISEKPFTTSVADAERALAVCKAAKVKVSIGYRLHFDPLHQELKRLARTKEFGALTTMAGANGFKMGRKIWRAEYALAGGGPLMDMGVYCVQAACMAADGAAPIAVTAKEHPKTRPEVFADVEEGLDWTMEFANGAKAELMTSYNQNVGRFRAEGTGGWIDFNPAFGYRGNKISGSKLPAGLTELPSQQAAQMDDFALCVREGRESRVSGEMGLRDMKIIAAIYEAAKTGKRTPVKA